MTVLVPISNRSRRVVGQLGLAVALAGLWLLAGLSVIGRAQEIEETPIERDLQLYINQVGDISPDDPRGVMTVTVIGPERLPPATLSHAQINEAGLPPISPDVVRVDDAPLRLVLAFDLSYDSNDDWRAAIDVAQGLIDSLQPGDELSIVRYDSRVRPEVIELEPPTSLTLAADDRFARGDSRTAFFQAALASTSQLTRPTAAWQGRQAVIVITNIGDNTDDLAATETAQETIRTWLPASTAPVHIFSFSEKSAIEKAKNNAEELREVARSTGGPAPVHVSEARDLIDPVRDRIAILRRAYRLTFDPIATPGRPLHPVTVEAALEAAGRPVTATATTQYTFNAYRPQITLFGPKWGYLNETVEITAAVRMPFPVKSVSYRVVGGPARVEEAPPYRFQWTADRSGPVTVSVTAEDRVGNTEAMSTALTIARRPEPNPHVRHPLGQALYLPIEATLTAVIDRVELYSGDGQFITQTTQSPFHFWLRPDEPGYPVEPGLQTFRVRIIDRSGRLSQEEMITVEFTRPPAIPGWVWLVLNAGLLLLLNFVILPFVLAVWYDNYYAELLNRRASYKFWLRNRGNVPTQFLIEVAATVSGTLTFNLRQRLASGPTATFAQPDASTPTAATPRSDQPTEPTTASSSQPDRTAPSSGMGQAGQHMGQMAGGGSAVMTATRQAQGVPGLGQIVTRWMQPVRQRLTGFKIVRNRLSRLSSMFRSNSPTQETRETPAVEQDEQQEQETPVSFETSATPAPPEASPSPPVETGWQQRPTLETGPAAPGETLHFHLELQPARLDERQVDFRFEIHTRPLETNGNNQTQSLTRTVSFKPRVWIYRDFHRLALILILAVITLDVVWVAFLLRSYLA